jgi:hypothetical protein
MSVVIWNDAHSTDGQSTFDEAMKLHHPYIIQTAGYVIRSDETGVLIAGEWLPPANDDAEAFRSITFVPKGMVISETAQPRPRKRRLKT